MYKRENCGFVSKYGTATVVIRSAHVRIIAFKGLDIIHVN
jgi:hypothetical protein